MEKVLYAQEVVILRKESENKMKKKKPRNINSKDNQQDQDVGLILIMSGPKKISGQVSQIYIKTLSKNI